MQLSSIIVKPNGHNFKAYLEERPEDFETGLTAQDALAKLVLKYQLDLGLSIIIF